MLLDWSTLFDSRYLIKLYSKMCFVYKHEDMNFTSNLLLFSILTELRFAWKIPQCWGTHVNEFGQWVFEAVFPSFCCLYLLRSLRDNLCFKKKKKKTSIDKRRGLFWKKYFLRELSRKYRVATYSIPPCMHTFFIQHHPSEQYIC